MINSVSYLDNSATTQIHPEVVHAMMPFLTNQFGNASSQHALGQHSRSALNQAREQVAALINADPSEIYFTPNATFSNNAAILGRAAYVEKNGLGRHVITCKIEHPSALEPVKVLRERGWKVTVLPVDREGRISIEQLNAAITDDTSIISIMWANNEVGTLQPIAEIARIAQAKGIFFHTDAVQAVGKVAIDVSAIQVDSLSLSGHKFHAPKGIGVLYVRTNVELSPVIHGGGQEKGHASGTENVAYIAALGKAAELANRDLVKNAQKLNHFAQLIAKKLAKLPQVQFTGSEDSSQRIPGLLSLTIDGWIGRDLVEAADRAGICISSSSACSSGALGSRVLKAMGHTDEEAAGAIRISVGSLNTEAECTRAANVLCQIIANTKGQFGINDEHFNATPSHETTNVIDRANLFGLPLAGIVSGGRY